MKKLITLLTVAVLAAPLMGFAGFALAAILTPNIPGVTLMAIPIQDAQSFFTKKLIAVWREMPQVTTFLRSFFDPVESMTYEISIEVQRNSESVAADVYRHSAGNRNKFDRYSEKIIVPPMYDEYFNANEHRLYQQVIAALSVGNSQLFSQMVTEQAEQLAKMINKIERSVEIQASQVLSTGIVILKSGENIDYKRKAPSLVDKGAGNYWATATVDPYEDLENSCNFIRQEGQSQGGDFICIMGSEALRDFRRNAIVIARADVRNFKLDELRKPVRESTGSTTHGEVAAGDYNVKIMGYPQFYTDANGVSQPYLDPKSYIMVPANDFIGKESYSAVPQLINDMAVPQKGRFLIQDFIDRKHTAHEVHAKSAPLIVPVKVDQMQTTKVVA